MRVNSLFTFKTAVVAVFTVHLTIFAPAMGRTETSESLTDKALKAFLSGGGNVCSKSEGKLTELEREFKEACSLAFGGTLKDEECYDPKKLERCAADSKRFESELQGTEDGETHEVDCQSVREFAQNCPGMLPDLENAKSELREYRRELKDLQSDRDKAKKDADEKRQKLQEELGKLDDDAANADKEWQRTRQELNERIQKEVAGIESEKTRANAETKKKMDEIDVEYIKMRDKIRRLSSGLTVMNSTWGIQCRIAADAEARVAEQEFDKRMAEESKIIRNYSFTSSARKLRNELKQKRRRIVNKYNETYSRCLKGEINPGAEMRAKLIAAQTDQIDSTATANEQAARLEKIRRESIESLQTLIQSLETQKQQTVTNLQNQINMLDQNHQMNSNRLQQRKMQSMQNSQIQMANADREMQNIADKIEEFRKDRTVGSALAKCNLPGKEQQKEARTGRSKMSGTLSSLKITCSIYQRDALCPDKPRSSSENLGTFGSKKVCENLGFPWPIPTQSPTTTTTPPRTTTPRSDDTPSPTTPNPGAPPAPEPGRMIQEDDYRGPA